MNSSMCDITVDCNGYGNGNPDISGVVSDFLPNVYVYLKYFFY
jgi:hypothetical protein